MTTADTQAPPSLAIRARPPSPKRLSRKVLLGGVLIAGAIIAFAVISGLSDNDRATTEAQDSVQAAAGPPESIAGASSSYDAASLPFASDQQELDLQPPEDPLWSGDPSREAGRGPPSAPAAARETAPDPQEVARTSSIMFASATRSLPKRTRVASCLRASSRRARATHCRPAKSFPQRLSPV